MVTAMGLMIYIGRRWYENTSAQHRLKKEINKRFKSDDKAEKNMARRDYKESFIGKNPVGPDEEEAK